MATSKAERVILVAGAAVIGAAVAFALSEHRKVAEVHVHPVAVIRRECRSTLPARLLAALYINAPDDAGIPLDKFPIQL